MLNSKTVPLSILFVSCIISIFLWGCQGTKASHEFNGGFEIKSPSNNEPAGWFARPDPHTKEFVAFMWDSTEHHSGSHSVSIAIDSSHPKNLIAYNWTRTFDDFTIGKKYSVSGWIKTENLKKSAWIVVQCRDADHKVIGFASNQKTHPVQGTNGWTQIKYDFTVPDCTVEVRLRAGIASPQDNGGKVWFDDIRIK